MNAGASSGLPEQPSQGTAILSPVSLKPLCVFTFGCAGSSLLLSMVVQSGGSSLVGACGLLTALAFPAAERGVSRVQGLQLLPFCSWAPDGRLGGCGTQA